MVNEWLTAEESDGGRLSSGTSAAGSILRISRSVRHYEHRYTRTVTEMDNMLFSCLTMNPQPLHIDRHFCEQKTEWGQPLMNSLFTLGLMIGISVNDLTVGTTVANLGMTDVKFPAPLFQGDTIRVETRVSASAKASRAPMPASSNSSTTPSSRTARWSPQCHRQAFMRKKPA